MCSLLTSLNQTPFLATSDFLFAFVTYLGSTDFTRSFWADSKLLVKRVDPRYVTQAKRKSEVTKKKPGFKLSNGTQFLWSLVKPSISTSFTKKYNIFKSYFWNVMMRNDFNESNFLLASRTNGNIISSFVVTCCCYMRSTSSTDLRN